MEDFPVHPLADQYPLLEGADLQELADGIEARGLIYPVTLWHGQIIDGRNRERACRLRNLPCRYEDRSDVAEEDLPEFIADLNERRRHLGLLVLKQLKAKRRERVREGRKDGKSLPALAKEEGVSIAQIQRDLEDPTLPGGKVVPESGKVKGRDNREQPASRPKSKPEANGHAQDEPVEERDGSDEESTSAALTDEAGAPIPGNLQEAFANRKNLRSLSRELSAGMKTFLELQQKPGGERLPRQKILDAFKLIRSDLRSFEPYAVCPLCKGKGCRPHDKAICRGTGWIIKTTFDNLPREHKHGAPAR